MTVNRLLWISQFLLCVLFSNGSILSDIQNCKENQAPSKKNSNCLQKYINLKEERNPFVEEKVYLFDLKIRGECGDCENNNKLTQTWSVVARQFNATARLMCTKLYRRNNILQILLLFSNASKAANETWFIDSYNNLYPNSSLQKPVAYINKDCAEACPPNSFCTTLYGAGSCSCRKGFSFNSIGKCFDITSNAKDYVIFTNITCVHKDLNIEEAGTSIVSFNTAFCQEKNLCGVKFPGTKLGDVAVAREKCPKTNENDEQTYFYVSIPCRRLRRFGAGFDTSSLTVVPCGETVNSIINRTKYSNELVQNFGQYTSYVQALTVNSSSLNEKEVEGIVDFLIDVRRKSRSQNLHIDATTSLRSIALIVSQLAEGYWNTSANPNRNNESQRSTTLQRTLAEVFPKLSLESTFNELEMTEIEIETPSFVMKRIDVDLEDSSDVEYAPKIVHEDGSTSSPLSLFIPSSVINQTLKDNENNSSSVVKHRTSYIYYKSDALFPSNKTVYNIFSVNVGLDESATSNFSEPISIVHQNVQKVPKSSDKNNLFMVSRLIYKCVFWDFNLSDWSTEGCWLNQTADQPQCLCNHMTNFGLLVVSEDVLTDTVLSAVSVVGCSLSIFGLISTVFLLIYKKELRKFHSAKILLHLCCSLAAAYLIFVCGVTNAVGYETGCTLVAVFLQYFFLVSMCWMMVYSFEMYSSLVKVFSNHYNAFFTKASIFAYILPAIIVSLSVSISVGTQNETKDNSNKPPILNYRSDIQCWIKQNSLYFGFLLPIGVMVAYNLVVFGLVTRRLRTHNENMINVRRSTIDSLIIAVTMTCIMGLTWIIGFFLLLARDEASYAALSWIFAITNTLQGFGIFLLISIRREDMRNIWWIPIKNFLSIRSKTSEDKSSSQQALSKNTYFSRTAKRASSVISQTKSAET